MEAVVLDQFGEADHLAVRSMPDPRPGPGEVLLRVHACGVCYHDVLDRRGRLPRAAVPAILGHEVAGEVIEVGDGVTTWKPGDRAATLQRVAGGYAALMVASIDTIARIPNGMPWTVAASVCCSAGTAVHLVRTVGGVRRGETVLVTGASGGVGQKAVQLARLDGARVIAVTTRPAKVEAVFNAGAHEVIVAPRAELAAAVRELTNGEGVDVGIEIAGSTTFAQTVKAMRLGGRVVVLGNLDSRTIDLDPRLLIAKNLQIVGARSVTQAELEVALQLTHDRQLTPPVIDVLPLHEAASAHVRVEQRKVTGRLVLCPDLAAKEAS